MNNVSEKIMYVEIVVGDKMIVYPNKKRCLVEIYRMLQIKIDPS